MCEEGDPNTLVRNGKRESLTLLERELQRRGIKSGLVAGDLLAANLGMRQETRKTVAEVLWKSIQENRGQSVGMTVSLECLVEIDSPEVREFLIEEAHAPEHFLHVVGRKADAIRALTEIDRDSAFRAAEMALLAERKDLELYPDLLIEIDQSRAIPVLFDAYSRRLCTFATWAVGRALRHVEDQTMVRSMLDRLMHVESTETRVTGVELSSWQPPSVFGDRIRQIAVTDPVTDVRRTAEKSAALVERQQFAIELLNVLEGTHGTRCWCYRCTRFTLSEPYLLGPNLDLFDFSDPRDVKLVSCGPPVDLLVCLGAFVSNGRIFHTTNGTGLQCSAVYGEEAKTLSPPWEHDSR